MSKNITHRPVAELDISELRELHERGDSRMTDYIRKGLTKTELVNKLKEVGVEWVVKTPNGHLLTFTHYKTIETKKGPVECFQEEPYQSEGFGTGRIGSYIECAAYCPRTGYMTSFGLKTGKGMQPVADRFLKEFVANLPTT